MLPYFTSNIHVNTPQYNMAFVVIMNIHDPMNGLLSFTIIVYNRSVVYF